MRGGTVGRAEGGSGIGETEGRGVASVARPGGTFERAWPHGPARGRMAIQWVRREVTATDSNNFCARGGLQ